MKKTKDIYAYILGGIFVSLPITIVLAYFTYSEKYVAPVMLLIMAMCLFKIRKEL